MEKSSSRWLHATPIVPLMLFISIAAAACTCEPPLLSPAAITKQRFDAAAEVFTGKVVDVVPTKGRYSVGGGPVTTIIFYKARVEMVETFKGTTRTLTWIDSGSGRGDCTFGRLIKGTTYLFYADRTSKGVLTLHSCSGTREFPGPRTRHKTVLQQHDNELARLRQLSSQEQNGISNTSHED